MVHRLSFAAVLAILLSPPLSAQQVNEYHIKAAYLYNLTKFVEWPPQVFQNAADPIVICVLGQSPIEDALAEAVKGEKIDGRQLIVRQIEAVQQVSGCHLLFIASDNRKHARSILEVVKTTGVLTVGETGGFLEEGGVVNFKLEGNKVLIEINMNAAERQKLRISSKLLSLARVVKK